MTAYDNIGADQAILLAAHQVLVTARAAVPELEAQLAKFDADHQARLDEREAAGADLGRVSGLEQLGEASAAQLKAARTRATSAEAAIAGSTAARGIIAERLTDAKESVTAAEIVFREAAAVALEPEHDRLRQRFIGLLHEVAESLVLLAKTDAVVSRIPRGTRSGTALMAALGNPLADVHRRHSVSLGEFGLPVAVQRLTESEILDLVGEAADLAAE